MDTREQDAPEPRNNEDSSCSSSGEDSGDEEDLLKRRMDLIIELQRQRKARNAAVTQNFRYFIRK